MQFHLNGFRTGNPEISEPSEQYNTSSNSDSLPNEVDVLVIGCGPAGLTLAAQLAAFPDIKTQIVASRLLLPRSGLERSDFVRWHL